MKRRLVCLVALSGFLVLSICLLLDAQEPVMDTSHPFLEVPLIPTTSPAGIPAVEEFSDERLRLASLGRQLFFDPILSADGSTSCATCHQPEHGFSTPDPIAAGVGGKKGKRHPPAILNRHLGVSQFWDGRAATLEEQALLPIENADELASSVEDALKKLGEVESYKNEFERIFDDGITRTNLASAIATFEELLVTGDSPIDRFVTAQESVLTRSQRQGLWLYESKGGCWQCHTGQNYSDEGFHNTGVSWGVEPLDLGRFEHTQTDEHKGQFKTPTLRNVALSAPYMHNGSIKTLREVVEFYNRGGVKNAHLDHRIKPLNLTELEIDQLVSFLEALNGRYLWESPLASSDAEDARKDGE